MGGDSVSMQIAAWLQGVGTVAAVVLALFMQVFLVWFRRPRVRLDMSLDQGAQDLIPTTPENWVGHVCWFLRARVTAASGRDPATSVSVVVRDWQSPQSQTAPFAHGNELKWSATAEPGVRIPVGTWKHVDIVHWAAPAGDEKTPFLWLGLRSVADFPPPERFCLTEPGQYALVLVVAGDNIKPSTWRLVFTYEPGQVSSLSDLRQVITGISLEGQ